MKDRVVEFPNRFRIHKEDGSSEIVMLEALPGYVSEEGTPLSKGTLLSDLVCKNLALDKDTGTVSEALGVLASNMMIGKPKVLTNGKVKDYEEQAKTFVGKAMFDDTTENINSNDEYNGKEALGNDYKYSDLVFKNDNYSEGMEPKQALFWCFGRYVNSNLFAGTKIYLKCLDLNDNELYKIQIKASQAAVFSGKHIYMFSQIGRAKLYRNCKFQILVTRDDYDSSGIVDIHNFGIMAIK